MSEVTFAKSFLATLDKKPIKLPGDHISDPRQYPNTSPVRLPCSCMWAFGCTILTSDQFILSKNSQPFPKRDQATATQQAKDVTITATLKPMRSGETITLPDTTLDSTIHDLKLQYAQRTGLQQDKIKLLLNKKPAADLKTLKDLGINSDVELSVMVMGGGGTTPSVQSPAVEKSDPTVSVPTPATSGDTMDIDPAPLSEKADLEKQGSGSGVETAKDVLKTEEFWSDLKGFLAQRLKSQDEGEALMGLFREAWSKS